MAVTVQEGHSCDGCEKFSDSGALLLANLGECWFCASCVGEAHGLLARAAGDRMRLAAERRESEVRS